MDWAAVVGGAIGPVAGLIDQGWYTPQEQARDTLAQDSMRAQEQIARYAALATETQAEGLTTAVLIGAGGLIAAVALFALTR
jgi:hypothetical protein